ncbi:MAG: lamin tail domain-containing protein [Cyclobacteriaceae bacterium]|nr:lamin tail domain-containing protein [Cyclobacteriaceae bacterium]
MKIAIFLSLIGLLSFFSCSQDDGPQLIENEEIFINEVYAAGNDWLELYNDGETTKDVGGYFIYDDATIKYALPANTIIAAKGFLVLVCDDTGVGLHTNFKLSSSGETVYLENNAGKLIDKVVFPALGEEQSYGRYPDGSTNLAISGSSSEGLANGDNQAPAIAETSRTPLVPGLADGTTIKTELISTVGVTSVTLFYRLNGAPFEEIPMAPDAGFYVATIPAQNTTGKVEYYIEAKNNADKSTRDPYDAPSNVFGFLLNTDVLPSLFVNEFMAYNTTCCPDTDSGAEEFDDWIELYNAGPEAVDIGGMYMSDNKDNPFKYQIPADNPSATTIAAGGFLLLWADGKKSQGPLHLEFSLSNTGEDVGIYYIDGREIDAFSFGPQEEDKSLGRSSNGGNTWTTFTIPTPGLSNN